MATEESAARPAPETGAWHYPLPWTTGQCRVSLSNTMLSQETSWPAVQQVIDSIRNADYRMRPEDKAALVQTLGYLIFQARHDIEEAIEAFGDLTDELGLPNSIEVASGTNEQGNAVTESESTPAVLEWPTSFTDYGQPDQQAV